MRTILSTVLCLFGLTATATVTDSIPKARKYYTVGIVSGGSAVSLWALNAAWYSQYERESFHLFNDNAEWLQMDKAGHVLTAYHIGQFGDNLFTWSGMKKNRALAWGGSLGFTYLTLVEVLDGFSSGWGFSLGDMLSNAVGSGMYIGQECLWKEQRIVPKFSAHLSPYAEHAPELLGSGTGERLLKDYNGQVYWWSFNLSTFFPSASIPPVFSLSLGYGADGMISGHPEEGSMFERQREFLLSFDLDLWRIPCLQHTIAGKLLRHLSFIKIPFPALRIKGKECTLDPIAF